jgi:hypothetical protein
MLLALFTAFLVHAEVLETAEVRYLPPPAAPSCGLLRQRETERAKVIREQAQLRGREIPLANQLLLNKLFMPGDTWRDESVFVRVTARIPAEMSREIERLGLDGIYISLDAPGLVWQSFAFQTPDGMEVAMDGEGRLVVTYQIYLNTLCLEKLERPVIEWIPPSLAPERP